MRAISRCAAVFMALSSAPAEAQSHPSAFVSIVMAAQATALSEFCVNWAIDSNAVRRFLRSRNVRIAGENRVIFGEAYARTHANVLRGENVPAACDTALDL